MASLLLAGASLVAHAQPALACDALPGAAVLRIELPTRTLLCDAAALTTLPVREVRTTLPPALGLAGTHRWQGVSLRELLLRAGVQPRQRVRLRALNDYAVEIPWSDLEQFDPVLAQRRDGRLLAVRDKGPLILIYPFDTDSRLQAHEYLGRSIWQVHAVTVR